MMTIWLRAVVLGQASILLWAQNQAAQPDNAKPAPIYRVTVVSRSLSAINYQHRGGPTKIDFKGTVLLPAGHGEATVESKKGRIEIDAKFDHLEAPRRFGREYLTYILWAISPQGRVASLGEVVPGASDKAELHVTTDLQVFGLIVTAEPYFSVSRPSDVVVLENQVRQDTLGEVEQVKANYELMPRGEYLYNVQSSDIRSADAGSPRVSMDEYEALLELYEAQNAVQIAGSLGADRYAPEAYQKASQLLEQARDLQRRKMKMRSVVTLARSAAQTAEDARGIAVKRQDDERLAQAQDMAAKAEVQAQQAEIRTAAASAQVDAERISRERSEAEAARANQLVQQEVAQVPERDTSAGTARNRIEQSDRAAPSDKKVVRARLQRQLTPLLDTRDTPSGLVVTIPDSAFETSSTLRAAARESLARIAAIVTAYAGLTLEVFGHTDAQGADTDDQQISELRAEAVRNVLIRNGIQANKVAAHGFGKSRPLVSNSNAEGRARNRRVELVISGDPIGTLASWDHTYTLHP